MTRDIQNKGIAIAVAGRFIGLGYGTRPPDLVISPKPEGVYGFRASRLVEPCLHELEESGLVRRIDTRYFPGFASLELLDPQVREFAKGAANAVLNALKKFASTTDERRLDFVRLLNECRQEYAEIEGHTVIVGALFATEFGRYTVGFSLAGTGNLAEGDVVESITISDFIHEYDSISLSWLEEVRRRILGNQSEGLPVNLALEKSSLKLALLRKIAERYVIENQPTQRQPLRISLDKVGRATLDQLQSEGLLNVERDVYVPALAAFRLQSPSIRHSVFSAIDVLLKAMGALYRASSGAPLQFDSVVKEAQKLDPTLTEIYIKTAFYLCQNLHYAPSWSGDAEGNISSITVSENILDYESLAATFNDIDREEVKRLKIVSLHRKTKEDVETQAISEREPIWDCFICHASEDKDDFVRPLAQGLQTRGLKIWFDETTLRLGDRLRRTIDHGLKYSRFGVVVLSPAFFSKHWPQIELDGLAARESDGRRILIPVWHNVDFEYVKAQSPTLADRVAVKSSQGLQSVCEAIMKAIH